MVGRLRAWSEEEDSSAVGQCVFCTVGRVIGTDVGQLRKDIRRRGGTTVDERREEVGEEKGN